MSQENVEIVRGVMEAFNSGGVGAALDAMDPDVEFVGGGGATYHGHAGLRELERLLREAFGEIRMEPDEFRPAGDVVVVLGHVSVEGRASGAVGQSRRAWVATLRGGKIVRMQTYDDEREALEATGLQE